MAGGFMPGAPSETPANTEMVTAARFKGGAGSEDSLAGFTLKVLLLLVMIVALVFGSLYLAEAMS